MESESNYAPQQAFSSTLQTSLALRLPERQTAVRGQQSAKKQERGREYHADVISYSRQFGTYVVFQ
jgi:hypothetical protein